MECECVSITENGDKSLTVKLKSADKLFPDSFCDLTSDFIWKVFEVGKIYVLTCEEVKK